MGTRPVGRLLVEEGLLSEASADDILRNQRESLPFASMSYVLGYVPELPLVRSLARQKQHLGFLSEQTSVFLPVLGTWSRELATRYELIPVFEDDARLFIATTEHIESTAVMRHLAIQRHKRAVPCIALRVPLVKLILASYRARDRGDRFYSVDDQGPGARLALVEPSGELLVLDDTRSVPASIDFFGPQPGAFAPTQKDSQLPFAMGTEVPALGGADHDASFQHALEQYKRGQVQDAIRTLRLGLKREPLSVRHHFVLANLLHKEQRIFEAIDEYETTVLLRKDYFPALTRLAYLYYRKGFVDKALTTWERALPLCPDDKLRRSIQKFVARVVDTNRAL